MQLLTGLGIARTPDDEMPLVTSARPLAFALMHWWMHLQPGDRGTWVSGIATFMTLAVTLIITAVNWIHQRRQSLELRTEEQAAARRSHAEKFSCWISGRVISLPQLSARIVSSGDLVVTLMNASEQPFTEALVDVKTKAQGPAGTFSFTISVVPPGMSWFVCGSSEPPETLLPSSWFFDNGGRLWRRSSDGALEETAKLEPLEEGRRPIHVSLLHGNPFDAMEIDDAWAPWY